MFPQIATTTERAAPRPRTLAATLTTLAACAAFPAGATVFEMGPEFNTVTTEVATPHVRWARPLASGKLRLLVVAPRFGHRETAELMQRLDCECDVVMTHSYKALGVSSAIRGFRESDVLDALRSQLRKPHDAIIVGNVPWSLLPKPLQYEMLRQVSEGVGLLQVNYYGSDTPELFERLFEAQPVPEMLLKGVQWGAFPSLDSPPEGGQPPLVVADSAPLPEGDPKRRVVRFCGTLKRGRCLVLRWPAGAGGFHCLTSEPVDRIEFEYNAALVVRAVLWAARREPGVRIEFPSLTSLPYEAKVGLPGLTGAHTVDAVVRDRFGDETHPVEALQQDGAVVLLPPGGLGGGRHFLDLFVRKRPGQEVVAWGSSWFDVVRDGAIKAVSTDREHYKPGDEVRVKVEFGTPVSLPSVLAVSAIDVHGREWVRVSAPVDPGQDPITVSFKASGMLSTYSRLRVDLLRGAVLQRAYADLYVPLRQRPEFGFGVWGGGGRSWLSHQRWLLNRERGIDATIFSGDIKADVRPTPYASTRFRHGGKGDVRNPCLTDPGFWKQERERLHKTAKSIAKDDVLAYSLGDEICLDVGNTSLCRSPTCLAGFRAWLRDRHGDLGKLNQVWGAEFKSWEEVAPKGRRKLRSSGNLAPWFEHRLFMDKVFADGLRRARDIIHEVDPAPPVGAEGLWGSGPAYGMDWRTMARDLRFLGPYWRRLEMTESIRSFKTPDTIATTWFGNYHEQGIDTDKLRWCPWNVLINSFNSVSWYAEYRAVQFGAATTGVAPDFRATAGLAAALDEVRIIRSGLAALLLRLRREHDGIAVLYSRPSIHVWGALAEELLVVLEELGLQYNVVAPEDLAPDRMSQAGYRVLMLPGACVLSDAEAERIAAFVRQGGRVLALLPPGVYDVHGRCREKPVLADVFGVEVSTRDPAKESTEVVPAAGAPFTVSSVATVAAAGGKTLASFKDGGPAAVLNDFGEGQALLLCFSLTGLKEARTSGEGDLEAREFLGAALRKLGVEPPVQVVSDAPTRGLEIARFTDGVNEYVGLTIEPLAPLKRRKQTVWDLALRFAESRVTYDAKTGASLGKVGQAQFRAKPGDSFVFARLRAAPPAPSVRLSSTSLSPGESVTVAVESGVDYPRVLHLTVAAPNGAEARFWTQNLFVEHGKTETKLDVALNAAPGAYKATLRDPVSGTRVSATFEVRAD